MVDSYLIESAIRRWFIDSEVNQWPFAENMWDMF